MAPEKPTESQNRARRPQNGRRGTEKHPGEHESALKLVVFVEKAPCRPAKLVQHFLAERVCGQGVRCCDRERAA